MMLAFTTFLVFSLLAVGHGYPDGAGSGACDQSSMMPQHPNSNAMTTTSPYTFTLNTTTYKEGEYVAVTVTGSIVIEGFLLLALPSADEKAAAVGSFEIAKDANGVDINKDKCSGGTTHTQTFHDESPHYDNFTVIWKAPSSEKGSIKFFATVVRRTTDFWVKIPSAEITYSGGATGQAGVTLSLLIAMLGVRYM